MKREFRLADIGEGLEEAEIIEWRVAVGDVVRRDQPLVEVMTDKSNAELPAPFAGTVTALGGGVGDIITVGELIAIIDDGETATARAPTATEQAVVAEPTQPTEPVAAATFSSATQPVPQRSGNSTPPSGTFQTAAKFPGKPKASPATRAEAVRRGLDLATVQGTGPAGRILMSDLDAATSPQQPESTTPSPAPPPTPPTPTAPASPAPSQIVEVTPAEAEPVQAPFTSRALVHYGSRSKNNLIDDQPGPVGRDAATAGATVELRGIRRRIAVNMTQSWTRIPHIHVFDHIDAEPMIDMRLGLRATGQSEFDNLTPLAFFVAAVASAMRAFPQANASLDMASRSITTHPDVNVGVAVASPDGLVVPVLHQADTFAFPELAASLDKLVSNARSGALRHGAFAHGTTTVTNFGSLGGEQATPLIRPPESLIFGFGSVAERPFVIDGQVVARSTMHIVLGADHRLLDGDVVTAILSHVVERLTQPLTLLVDD